MPVTAEELIGDLRRASPGWTGWTILGLGLILVIGIVDYVTGYEISVALFYLIPIAIISLKRSRWEGTLGAVLAGLCWFLAEYLLHHPYTNSWYIYWNTGIRLGIFLLVAFLLTTLQKILRQERQHRLKFEELNLLKNRFLGMAAHDLRTPLVVIQMFTDLILRDRNGQLTKRQIEFLDVVQMKSNFMLNLISDLLDISMIESGKLELKRQKNDYREFLSHRIQLYEILAGQRQIAIHLEFPGEVPPLSFDPDRIEQVIDNLTYNAIKFAPAESTVTISAQKDGNRILTKISDTGPGIPAEDLGDVFLEFHQAGVESAHGDKGTGLGLAIAKKIVESHGGKIWVESRVGEGTTFFFEIPLNGTGAPHPE